MYRTSLSFTPLIIFDGNCQAHHLAAVFSASGLAESFCIGEDYGFVPSYNGIGAQFTTIDEANSLVRSAKDAGRPVYQASQTTQMQEFLNAPYTSVVDKVLKFPFLQLYAIAPHEFYNMYKRNVDPSRLLSLDIKLIEVLQKKAECAFDFAAFVSNDGTHRPIFNTHNHPRGELTARLFSEVARMIPEIDAEDLENVVSDLQNQEGINHVTVHPISTEILSSLGYNWGKKYNRYASTLTAAAQQRWLDVLAQIDAESQVFRNDTQLLISAGRAVNATCSIEGRYWLFERLTDLSPGFVHSWTLRNQFLMLAGKSDQAVLVRRQARAALGRSRYYSQVRAWLEIQSGNFERSLPFARDYCDRTPDRPDAVLALVKALSLLGRLEEARQIFISGARIRGRADIAHFASFLADLAELEMSGDELMRLIE